MVDCNTKARMERFLKFHSQGKKNMSVKSLLVVEDEVLVARDIKARLTRMGYNVLDTAMKGQEAVEKALALKPDLILMDIHLADEIDGIEAAIRIKKELDVPVIFCTAYADEETLDRAKISEPFGYVLKPFDNRELEILRLRCTNIRLNVICPVRAADWMRH
ncbi:MAG TPA: response regulator [Dehalococcoidia bacterium]|nr:response regulator [Dehalococcoidia bacterium]